MPLSRWRSFSAVVVLLVGGLTAAAQADVLRNVAFGLGYAGFDLEGRRNPLSGETDFRIGRNLVGNPLDFGLWDLTLQGPISLELSTGGRLFQQVDLAFTTALTADSPAVPLSYALNYGLGGQSAEVNGAVLIDTGLSLNQLGFYDLEFIYSVRQTVSADGESDGDDQTASLDLGPVKISGNIFADVLALLTGPLYERTGQPNPFIDFSGPTSLSGLLSLSADAAQQSLAAGGDPVEEDLSDASAAAKFNASATPLKSLELNSRSNAIHTTAIAPEPASLLLILAALPLVAARPLRRRRDR